jgi:prophage maintenance system killer protein
MVFSMGGGGKQEDPRGREMSGVSPGQRYGSSHGDSSRALHANQGRSAASPRDAGARGFPTLEQIKELNQKIHEDDDVPEFFKLDQPSPLESCLDRARAVYADTPEAIIKTAALLAQGIAQAQAFRDGNRRTAYAITRWFLDANGLAYLTSSDNVSDHSLARYLNQVVEGPEGQRPGPEKFEALFLRRYRERKAPT